MANIKQKYEKKKVISLIGTLDIIDNNEYVVMVEDGDEVEEYMLKDVLKEMEGNVIKISSEIL